MCSEMIEGISKMKSKKVVRLEFSFCFSLPDRIEIVIECVNGVDI